MSPPIGELRSIMIFDLKKVREEIYHAQKREFAKIVGIGEVYYSEYEKKGEIPSKYIYLLWQNLKDFPIPSDFFIFTSATLQANMSYHHINQEKIREMFGFSSQTTVSKYLKENYPMYEMKEIFLSFDPLIVPFQALYEKDGKDTVVHFAALTDLNPSGNLTESFLSRPHNKSSKEIVPV